MKRYAIVGIAAAFVVLLGMWGPAVPSASAQEAIRIGAILPLTGPSSFGGERERQGIELAVEEINGLGGVMGRPLEVIFEDDQTNPPAGMDAVHKLVEVDKVPLILGAHNSSVTIPTATFTGEHHVIQISIASTSPDIRKIGPYHFSVIATDEIMASDLAKFAIDDLGEKDFAIMVMNDAYGVGLLNSMRKSVEDAGGTVVEEVRYEIGKSDYRAELQRLFAKNPPAVLSTCWAEMCRIQFKQAFEMGLYQKVQNKWYVAYLEENVDAAIPESVQGLKGLDVTAGPRMADFEPRYRAKFGGELQYIAFYPPAGYDATWIAALGMMIANSTDPEKVVEVLPTAFRSYHGVMDPNMAVDDDGMQTDQSYGRHIYCGDKVVDYKAGQGGCP